MSRPRKRIEESIAERIAGNIDKQHSQIDAMLKQAPDSTKAESTKVEFVKQDSAYAPPGGLPFENPPSPAFPAEIESVDAASDEEDEKEEDQALPAGEQKVKSEQGKIKAEKVEKTEKVENESDQSLPPYFAMPSAFPGEDFPLDGQAQMDYAPGFRPAFSLQISDSDFAASALSPQTSSLSELGTLQNDAQNDALRMD